MDPIHYWANSSWAIVNEGMPSLFHHISNKPPKNTQEDGGVAPHNQREPPAGGQHLQIKVLGKQTHFFPLSFPQEKNNNEAQIRRFWTVLARHLCLGSGCSPFPFKIACTSWVPLTCMQLCLSVHIRKPQDRVFSFLIKKCELLEHLWTTSLT